MKTLIKRMREEKGRARMREKLFLIFWRALVRGPSQTSSRETSPIGIPRWVPLSAKGRSGHGEALRPTLMLSNFEGGLVVTTKDLGLLIPRPEISENLLMRVRAG